VNNPEQPKSSSADPASAVTDTAVPPPASTRTVWRRIRDHKVVQWTLAYLALAYTLLHGAEMLGNSLGWSHSLLRVFTLLLILGVPVVIILSWYHGARGLRRVSGTELMIIAILLAIGGTFLWRDSRTEHATASASSADGVQKSSDAAPAPAPPERCCSGAASPRSWSACTSAPPEGVPAAQAAWRGTRRRAKTESIRAGNVLLRFPRREPPSAN
jgi:hypothetical protein